MIWTTALVFLVSYMNMLFFQLLQKKVDVLMKAAEVESKKTRRIEMVREKEMFSKLEDDKHNTNIPKR